MKSRTMEELVDLDEHLDLFEEQDWNFLEVTEGENLEYFNDIRDTDFAKRSKREVRLLSAAVGAALLLFVVSGVWLYQVTVGRHVLTQGGPGDVVDRVAVLQRPEGAKAVSADEVALASRSLTSYFGVLKGGSNYVLLDNYCMVSSTFKSTEEAYRGRMEYAYDANDCYARAMSCFGKYFSSNKINEVLEKDGTYYVYMDMGYPDNDSLLEYFLIYSNDMTKYFNTNAINEQNIVKYIIQLADTYGLPSTNKEVCIEMAKNKSGELVMMDDSFVTSGCTSAYSYATSQVVKILGGTKAVNQYE